MDFSFNDRKVRHRSLTPGVIRTDFTRATWNDPKAEADLKKATPLGRIGEPQDIAGAAVFLASREGQYLTGQSIVGDDGTAIKASL